ncbi:major facilitator superfamily domain-containing protein [Clohesyomyces aquaticus]|uniref:Major facilitator superfamily domain-containing protein n=1 Tax=Clohesyomyces aquaticus TaxID=1231657 RepID=A0A1Y1Z9H7_9PLEO|nr:major facilitator superfamily domain-containing protein [Clohesyomyces aquaticus]
MTERQFSEHPKGQDLGDGDRIWKEDEDQSIVARSERSIDKERDGGGNQEEVVVAEKKEEDVPPDGGYGWVCVACIFVINGQVSISGLFLWLYILFKTHFTTSIQKLTVLRHTWGLNSSYGVFLAHYLANNVFPGATRLDYAFVGGLSISQALVVSPIATLTTRLWGTRTTLLIGVFFETISLIGASFATKISHLFLSQGVCFGWGMGFLFVGSVTITPQWFSKRRSLANGISASGSGIGGLIYSLAAQAMIKNISLAWAFRILGILACGVNTICALLVRDRNKQIGSSQLSFDYRLFRKIEFWYLLGFGFLSMLGYIVLLFSLPNYARTVGMTAQRGSIIGAMLNLGQALGRPPIGYFSDSFGRINMAGTMTFLAGLFSLVIWMFAKSFGVLLFFAIVGGTVAGTFWTVVGPVWTEVMGIVDLPSSLSITWLALVLPTTFSEAIALKIVDFDHGSYTGAILFTGFMYVGAAGFVWLVRAWKIGELQEKAIASGLDPHALDPVSDLPLGGEARGDSTAVAMQKSSFARRLFMWEKV